MLADRVCTTSTLCFRKVWQYCAVPWYCGWYSVAYASYWWWALYHHKGVQFLGVGWDWGHLVRRSLTDLLYQPWMIDDEYGAVGGMRIGRGKQSTLRKPAPAPIYSPQISHHLTWARTWASAVGSWRLTAWAMARPYPDVFRRGSFRVLYF
jgi:hypothetical protein